MIQESSFFNKWRKRPKSEHLSCLHTARYPYNRHPTDRHDCQGRITIGDDCSVVVLREIFLYYEKVHCRAGIFDVLRKQERSLKTQGSGCVNLVKLSMLLVGYQHLSMQPERAMATTGAITAGTKTQLMQAQEANWEDSQAKLKIFSETRYQRAEIIEKREDTFQFSLKKVQAKCR